MNSSILRLLPILLFLFTDSAVAHTRWQLNGTLPPRSDNAGIKSSGAPCGTRMYNTRTSLKAGQTLTIQWEETIDHPGHYEIWFSQSNDDNWILLKTISDNQSGRDSTPHFFTNTIQVPQVTCVDCTFQIRQIMTDRSPPTLYFSCADVSISPSNPTNPTPPSPPPAGGGKNPDQTCSN